jgi:hypothetical protein
METTSIERIKALHPKVAKEALAAYMEAVKATPDFNSSMVRLKAVQTATKKRLFFKALQK